MSTHTADEIWRKSGAEQARLIKQGDVSPVDVLDASLQRIEDLDSQLNAFCVLDEEGAKEAAREAERAVENGDDLGLLHGVPVGIKDLITVEGMRTTYGSKLYEEFIPERDSVPVSRIRDEGGIILGKTNVPEFGYQGITDNAIFGKTHNPWDTSKTPGGRAAGPVQRSRPGWSRSRLVRTVAGPSVSRRASVDSTA